MLKNPWVMVPRILVQNLKVMICLCFLGFMGKS